MRRKVYQWGSILGLLLLLPTLFFTHTPVVFAQSNNACLAHTEQLSGQGRYAIVEQGRYAIVEQGRYAIVEQGDLPPGANIPPGRVPTGDELFTADWILDPYAMMGHGGERVAIIIVDDFSTANAHGVFVRKLVMDMLAEINATLQDSKLPAPQITIETIDMTSPPVSNNPDNLAQAIKSKIMTVKERDGITRFVVNMSFALIACSDPATGWNFGNYLNWWNAQWDEWNGKNPDGIVGPPEFGLEQFVEQFVDYPTEFAYQYVLQLLLQGGNDDDDPDGLQETLADLQKSDEFDVVAVASSGNYRDWFGNGNHDNPEDIDAPPFAPAKWPSVIAVGAYLGEGTKLWEFSQDGQVFAPGAWYHYLPFDKAYRAGTSFSAPVVSTMLSLPFTHPTPDLACQYNGEYNLPLADAIPLYDKQANMPTWDGLDCVFPRENYLENIANGLLDSDVGVRIADAGYNPGTGQAWVTIEATNESNNNAGGVSVYVDVDGSINNIAIDEITAGFFDISDSVWTIGPIGDGSYQRLTLEITPTIAPIGQPLDAVQQLNVEAGLKQLNEVDKNSGNDIDTVTINVSNDIVAPQISSTVPTNNADNVPVDSTIRLNFSEAVTVQSNAVTVACGGQAITYSGLPQQNVTSVTLTPATDLPDDSACDVTVSSNLVTDEAGNPLDGDNDGTAGGDYITTFTTEALQARLAINEIDTFTGSPDNAEFIEVYDGGVGQTSLDGIVLLLADGLVGHYYGMFDLTGYATDRDGFFAICVSNTLGTTDCDLNLNMPAAFLRNGPAGIALAYGTSSMFYNGSFYDEIELNLVDAVVYGSSETIANDLLQVFTPDSEQVDENTKETAETDSLQRCPDGVEPFNSATFITAQPTMGSANDCSVLNVASSANNRTLIDAPQADELYEIYPVNPALEIYNNRPTFAWWHNYDGTHYHLWIANADGVYWQKIYEATDICDDFGYCRVRPTVPMPVGTFYWTVRSTNGTVVSPWSVAAPFYTSNDGFGNGDVDGDGLITPIDVMLIINAIESDKSSADLNGDGIVGFDDWQMALDQLGLQGFPK